MIKRTNVSVLALCAALLLPVSCSKDSAAPTVASGPGLQDSAIVSYLPDGTFGFAVWDTSTEAYKRFRATPWGEAGISKSFEMMKGSASSPELDEERKKMLPVIEALEKSGFFPKPGQPDVLKEGVIFASLGKAIYEIGAGVLATGAPGVNLKEKIVPFESVFKAQGLPTAPITVEGMSGFSVSFPELKTETNGSLEKVLVVADAGRIAIGTSEQAITPFIKSAPSQAAASLKGAPQFAKTVQSLPVAGTQLAFMYIDTARVLSILGAAVAAEKTDAGAEVAEFKPEDVPVDAIAMVRNMDTNLSDAISVSMNPKTDSQKKVLTSLSTANEKKLVKKVPSDLTLLVSIDGAMVTSIRDAALADTPPEQAEMMRAMLGFIDSIKEVGIGLRNQTGASPFPEILVVAESSNPNELLEMIKMQLGAVAGEGGFLSPLQEKDIEGTKVAYALSPFGVGVYMGASKDNLILTSSEPLAKDLIVGSSSSPDAFSKGLSGRSQQIAQNPKALVLAYSNFERMASMIEQTQGSLSMFTGGQAALPKEQTDAMKKLGSSIVSVQYADGLFKLQSSYESPTAKQG